MEYLCRKKNGDSARQTLSWLTELGFNLTFLQVHHNCLTGPRGSWFIHTSWWKSLKQGCFTIVRDDWCHHSVAFKPLLLSCFVLFNAQYQYARRKKRSDFFFFAVIISNFHQIKELCRNLELMESISIPSWSSWNRPNTCMINLNLVTVWYALVFTNYIDKIDTHPLQSRWNELFRDAESECSTVQKIKQIR
jgi:hypothetical protein